jgi:hypothetical protein
LGDPRRRDFAIEWMTTHLTEDFSRAGNSPGASNEPPRCKDCHGGDLGSPAFRFKIILTDLATGAPMVEPAPSPLPELGEREH